ncbi:PREDICTED: structural maintenance of chromosomes protein 5 [Dinoponera quadriceps]|uniref:Structural maintenance of chromosomes protein 5 n=1 Tax=Dinoponera quadriceps TaxID=609295 RepID=A0A6P3XP32_DINQU|nr:PREDICTED: structural maintenance of chromosomes protein 5 [Dinoponera quadriceps]XP_014480266.1 PREDICTED: structural maintenance of chromosomes protein 5 [Dinoponera quadriceps]XP_014480267.1 PREDICTED: structural maintenance of chromosomes protein 5 [Dinoponera quadriceps]
MGDTIDKGIITYICLENFITYDRVSVKPGRYLNVIIGPNGSGKSSIVAAIVLGLGGKLTIIGRATHIGEYVKYGCEFAKIEIRLKNGKNQDHVITRVFTKQGKSTWKINDAPSTIKAVQAFAANFNIQVDNFCQFLPQDRVQDFSKMDAQTLLENTERSVGNPILLEYHQQLKEYRASCKTLENEITNKKRLLESKIQVHNGMKETVSTIKERKQIKKKITLLKQKKAWMLYDYARRKLLESKKKRTLAVNNMQSIKDSMKPLENKIAQITSEAEKIKHGLNNHNDRVQAENTKLRSIMMEILNTEEKIKEAENTCSRRIQVEQTRNENINLLKQKKCKLENDLSLMINEIGSEESLKELIINTTVSMQKHKNVISNFTAESVTSRNKEENLNRDIRALEAEYKSLNIDAKRMELLRRKSIDAYKGVLWLRENRDKFSGLVHEPMLLSINVKDASYAKYLENVIALRDLIAFTCENKRDMNLLISYLREQQKLQVNIVHSDPMKIVTMHPIIPIEEIQKFGFKHYLVSLIEAPSTLMKYLVTMYSLNNIPVGSNAVEDNTENIPRNIHCYFSENNIYFVSTSKYTHATSTRISQISSTETLSIVLDKYKLQMVQQRLQNLQQSKNQIVSDIKRIEDQIREENNKLEKYRSDRNKYQQNMQQIEALQSRIRMAESSIMKMEKERTSIDNIKAECTEEIKTILKNQINVYIKYNEVLKKYYNCVINNEEMKFTLSLLRQTLAVKKSDIAELEDKYKEAERIYKQHDEEFQPLMKEAEDLYKEALSSTNNISPQDEAFNALNKLFEKLPSNIKDINHELDVANAKVFCMAKNVDAENVIREFDEIGKNIDTLTKFIETQTVKVNDIREKIEELKEKWLQPLQQLVEKINENFSSYFSAMDCAGEVTLMHGENIMDFDQYGLKIRVKFRDSDELQELTRHFQSGGERTVTTAIYMISLQELSCVPFRCVDEINQGMDAVNEKRIFDLLVKMTGRQGSSQYFLLTPKLLPDLTYADTVTVHCIYNRHSTTDQTDANFDFNTEAYCNHLASTVLLNEQ